MPNAREEAYDVCSNNAMDFNGTNVLYPTQAVDLVSDVWEPRMKSIQDEVYKAINGAAGDAWAAISVIEAICEEALG